MSDPEDDGAHSDEDVASVAAAQSNAPPVSKPLTSELIAPHITLLSRTGNGLSHAYTRLEIHDQAITDLDCLDHYPHLRTIDVSLNALLDVKGLASLEYLLSVDLHANLLTSIPPILDKKKYLQHVNIARNRLEKFDITSWPMCTWLNLNENSLTTLSLPDFPALQHLEVRANKLSSIQPLHAPKLQKLYLSANPTLSTLATVDLDDKPALQMLHFRDCAIEKLAWGEAQERLRSLVYLNLRGNQIANIAEIDHLAVLPALKILVLSENPIDQLPTYRLDILSRLPKLERLDKEPVTEEEREEAEN
ncbi:hypothetical protein DFS34DRAFT_585957, partial [Phlyctochytrium arcticum]